MNRLLKIAAPALAAIGVLAVTAPAEARCWYDSYGNQICRRGPPPPPVYYAPPPPVYYAPPPRYYAPPPRAYYAPPPPRYYGPSRPVVNFGVTF
ncbi:hypothetical protein EDC65_3666 [Stella humosa]|uniref:PXPV repeat-containing protein n=1 Tax=Stella humosa TaxID=94 RepID=A0A3N1L1I0_9PROT|nr:hypothetical protein [Stella humosa]ROP84316.1 hypothetical protein EDC65_3666 [Stella humosa]BBK33830.1 hypothetical protein STHU_44640 [Stella humosa]